MEGNEKPKPDSEEASGSLPRPCVSESSLSGEENAETDRSWRSSVSNVPASPPRFVSLEEIMSAANCLQNMVLAHAIAVDKDFKLQKPELPDNSVRKIVKETFHKAFWDLLQEQLNEDPPNYTQALVLLEDIKEDLLSLLLPQHTKMKENILEVLETKFIEQQIQAGALNFNDYAKYVISIMGKLCAPARDEKINELKEMTNIVQCFRGILELLEVMKLDMANFAIDCIRPGIVASSVEYEKQKFKELLATQQDGLKFTRHWLLKNLPEGEYEGVSFEDIKKLTEKTLAHAYIDLLEWPLNEPYPETLVLDEVRFREVAVLVFRSSIICAILLLALSHSSHLQGVESFRDTVIKHLTALMSDVKSNEDLMKTADGIAAQVVKDVNDSLRTRGHPEFDDEALSVLVKQVIDVSDPNNRIRNLVCKRIKEFLLLTITSPTAAPIRIPPGLSCLKVELTAVTGTFLRLVSHNRVVFSEYYLDIVAAAVKKKNC